MIQSKFKKITVQMRLLISDAWLLMAHFDARRGITMSSDLTTTFIWLSSEQSREEAITQRS